MPLSKETAKEFLVALMAVIKEVSGDGDDEKPKGKKKKSKSEITLDDIKDKLVEFVAENGKPAARKIMKKFNVEKLDELEEDDYEDFMTAISDDGDADATGDDDDDEKQKGKGKSKKDKDDLFGDD